MSKQHDDNVEKVLGNAFVLLILGWIVYSVVWYIGSAVTIICKVALLAVGTAFILGLLYLTVQHIVHIIGPKFFQNRRRSFEEAFFSKGISAYSSPNNYNFFIEEAMKKPKHIQNQEESEDMKLNEDSPDYHELFSYRNNEGQTPFKRPPEQQESKPEPKPVKQEPKKTKVQPTPILKDRLIIGKRIDREILEKKEKKKKKETLSVEGLKIMGRVGDKGLEAVRKRY